MPGPTKPRPTKNRRDSQPAAPERVADRGVRIKSAALRGRKIALAVSGGIASVEVVKIARELRRHEAWVQAFFTPSVTEFIGELSVEWATENPVVTRIGANVDHLLAFDLVVVAPATLNTIVSCALGICDNPVTLLVAGTLGRGGKILFVPTMNGDLRNHPRYDEYRATLEGWGANFLESEETEGRLKMPAADALVRAVENLI